MVTHIVQDRRTEKVNLLKTTWSRTSTFLQRHSKVRVCLVGVPHIDIVVEPYKSLPKMLIILIRSLTDECMLESHDHEISATFYESS